MPPLILSDKAHITQGDLPHWDDKKAIYFATFRLADSLPITAMKEFKAWEEDKLELLNHSNVATTAWEEFERERQDLIEKLSDKGHGACILQRPNIRQVVGDTLLHYDKLRYWVHCFVIMPNHVHVMFECAEGYQMQEIFLHGNLSLHIRLTRYFNAKVLYGKRRVSTASYGIIITMSVCLTTLQRTLYVCHPTLSLITLQQDVLTLK